jgi:hypothetical protein
MNHYNKLRILLEVRGTQSQEMKDLAAVSAKVRAEKERIKNARAVAALPKKKKT